MVSVMRTVEKPSMYEDGRFFFTTFTTGWANSGVWLDESEISRRLKSQTKKDGELFYDGSNLWWIVEGVN